MRLQRTHAGLILADHTMRNMEMVVNSAETLEAERHEKGIAHEFGLALCHGTRCNEDCTASSTIALKSHRCGER